MKTYVVILNFRCEEYLNTRLHNIFLLFPLIEFTDKVISYKVGTPCILQTAVALKRNVATNFYFDKLFYNTIDKLGFLNISNF